MVGSRVASGHFIDASALEVKPFRFDSEFGAARFDLSARWKVAGPVRAAGVATLLDRDGRRLIRVRGRIRARIGHSCDRCLAQLEERFDTGFDLHFSPLETIEDGGEAAIGRDEIEMGFYEGGGIGLTAVVSEQILLWLPARSLCGEGCRGICPSCGANRNDSACGCSAAFEDPRWDALRGLQLNR